MDVLISPADKCFAYITRQDRHFSPEAASMRRLSDGAKVSTILIRFPHRSGIRGAFKSFWWRICLFSTQP